MTFLLLSRAPSGVSSGSQGGTIGGGGSPHPRPPSGADLREQLEERAEGLDFPGGRRGAFGEAEADQVEARIQRAEEAHQGIDAEAVRGRAGGVREVRGIEGVEVEVDVDLRKASDAEGFDERLRTGFDLRDREAADRRMLVEVVELARVEVADARGRHLLGPEAGSAARLPESDELGISFAQEGAERHAVEAVAGGDLRRVEVAVRVDPERGEALAVAFEEVGHGGDLDAAISSQEREPGGSERLDRPARRAELAEDGRKPRDAALDREVLPGLDRDLDDLALHLRREARQERAHRGRPAIGAQLRIAALPLRKMDHRHLGTSFRLELDLVRTFWSGRNGRIGSIRLGSLTRNGALIPQAIAAAADRGGARPRSRPTGRGRSRRARGR